MRNKRELVIIHVDAFSEVPFGGNPASVVLCGKGIPEEDMQKIATELNVRETVFVMSSKVADHRFRYMSPKGEIGFSSHATIAAFHALLSEGLVEAYNDVTMATLETESGVLQVDIVKNDTTGTHEVQITHEQPAFLATYDPKEYAEALGLSLADILSPNPIQTVNTGAPCLVIPLTTRRALHRIDCDWKRLAYLQKDSDYNTISVFTRETHEETSDAEVRHFAPAHGVLEDPVGGIAAGSVASYMIRHGLMDASVPVTSIVIEQGHSVGRPGRAFVEVTGDRDAIKLVKVSGTGVVVFRGTIFY
ncbi:MAG: PhzF family phenazine biosynthesis protein [Candidatus Hodarchaeota archaeon]